MRQNSILKYKFLFMRHRHFKTLNTFPNYVSHNYKNARSVYARVIAGTYTYVSTRCISCIGAAAAEMATATTDDVYVHWIQYCIRGYHVYQRIWYPTIGEILGFARERDNTHDRYAVAVCCPTYWQGCILGWALKKAGYLSVFRARHGYDRLWILWHVLIMRHKS